jgi:hypothetical protein
MNAGVIQTLTHTCPLTLNRTPTHTWTQTTTIIGTDITTRLLGRYTRASAHLRNQSRGAGSRGATPMRATTQGEGASATALSSCAGRCEHAT